MTLHSPYLNEVGFAHVDKEEVLADRKSQLRTQLNNQLYTIKEGNADMKRIPVLVAAVVLTLALVVGVVDAKQYTIGIILKSFSNPFWMMCRSAALAEGQRLGVKVFVVGTTMETDFAAQVAQIEDFVTKKVDLICVVPSDASALVPAVENAVAKGVPVIALDSAIRTDKVVSFIASDNVEGGRMAAEFIAQKLGGKGSVAVIRGRQGDAVELERYTGFTETLKKYPNMKIVAEGAANWEADQGFNVMEDFLIAHPEIQAVFAESDRMILGAAGACASAKRKDIILVGLDGIVDALRAVKDGVISADVAQRPDKIGEYAVKYGLEYLQGKTIPKRIVTPMVLATPDNVDPLIKIWEDQGY